MIFVCGMGGSAIVGDYLKLFLDDEPVEVVRRSFLPRYATSRDKYVVISYSGNTEETILCFKDAVSRSKNVFVISSGGKLLSMARNLGIKYYEVPEGYQPRFALPFMVERALQIFDKNAARIWMDKWERIKISYSEAREIAKRLNSKIVEIIVADEFYPIGYRFKTMLNENAKLFSKVEVIPEMNHNEIECFYRINKLDVSFILIETGYENREVQERFQKTKELIKRVWDKVVHIRMDRGDYMDRIIYLTKLLDEVSIELARRRGIKSFETKNISYIKGERV